MTSTTLRILLYALVAATSPLALAATLAVLRSKRGRINGAAFAIGFLVTQAAVCLLAFVFDAASLAQREDSQHTLGSFLALGFGIALLVTAAYLHRHPRHHEQRPLGPRTQAMMTRLEQLTLGAALGTGAALGFGGPKRLSITVLGAATISAADLPIDQELGLVALYVLMATVLVWIPVVLFIVFGTRATDWMNAAQEWAYAHEQPLTFYPSLVLGVVLVVESLTFLL
jgi:Sap, sulfolipid-1-addressing protein